MDEGDASLTDLDKAWQDFLGSLVEAQQAMTDPACFPPPVTDRNNAEGYRYLLGHLHRLIETEIQQDPDFPYVQRHPGLVGKYTIDNADCSYLYFPVRPDAYYRFTAKAADFSHWSRRPRPVDGRRCAPNYVIFESHTVAPGDSGGVQELFDGSRVIVDKLDSTELRVEEDGTFELLIGPQRPADHEGNFLATFAPAGTALPRGDTAGSDVVAPRVYLRELFADWEHEVPLDNVFVERVDFDGHFPTPRTANRTAAQLRQLGVLVRNHMRYWTTMYGELLDPFQQHRGEPRPGYLPVNELYTPRANRTFRGGGQATNAMTGGIFQLRDGEALIVELTCPLHPEQLGFHLGNFWGESLDFANHVSSLNHFQSYRSSDGVYRYVVSAEDPGIQNWMDTTGHPGGYLTVRFTYPEMPAEADLPTAHARLVPLDEVRKALPPDTPAFTAEDRTRQLRVRQRHVALRYRQY